MKRLQGFFYLAALLSVMLAFGCKKQPTDEELIEAAERRELLKYASHDDCGDPLCGNWQWYETGTVWEFYTPENTGQSQLLRLSHTGIWRWEVNGKLQDSGRYVIKRNDSLVYVGDHLVRLYDQIVFSGSTSRPLDRSMFKKYGLTNLGGKSCCYSFDGNYMSFSEQRGVVGGPVFIWVKL